GPASRRHTAARQPLRTSGSESGPRSSSRGNRGARPRRRPGKLTIRRSGPLRVQESTPRCRPSCAVLHLYAAVATRAPRTLSAIGVVGSGTLPLLEPVISPARPTDARAVEPQAL